MPNKFNGHRNAITKESIFTALMQLMEKKDFHKISITETTTKAGVSRMAFYRNYETLEDVITDYLNTFFNEYERQISSVGIENPHDIILMFLSDFKSEQQLLVNLIKCDLTFLLLDKCNSFLEQICEKSVCDKLYSPTKEAFTIKFLCGGFFNLLIEWASHDFKESEEYLADLFSEYC